jgi:hypothetical protein
VASTGPVDPRVESGAARPTARPRPRIVTRAPESAPPLYDEDTAPPPPSLVDPTPLAWSPMPAFIDPPTGPLDVIPAAVRTAPPPPPPPDDSVWRNDYAPAVEAVTAVPVVPVVHTGMPVVLPGTTDITGPGVIPMAPQVTVTSNAPRRKERPKLVRLPRRARVRKVSRVVRSIDAWSVFKISIVFYLAMYVVFLVAGVLLWNVAYSTGTIDNISSFFESFGWKNFEFKGGEIYHNAWIVGLFVAAGLTGLNVVLATLYNLITDLVGGIRVTVLEEEVLVRAAAPGPADPAAAASTTTLRPNRRERKFAKPTSAA